MMYIYTRTKYAIYDEDTGLYVDHVGMIDVKLTDDLWYAQFWDSHQEASDHVRYLSELYSNLKVKALGVSIREI